MPKALFLNKVRFLVLKLPDISYLDNSPASGMLSCLPWLSGEGNGNPLQYSCLENSMDWGAWWATVDGVSKSWTWLSNFTFTLPWLNFSLLMRLEIRGDLSPDLVLLTVLCLVAHLCLTLCNPMDCSLPVRGILQAEYWSGWPCPPPRDLPNAGLELRSPTLQIGSSPSESSGKPR